VKLHANKQKNGSKHYLRQLVAELVRGYCNRLDVCSTWRRSCQIATPDL